MLSLYISVDILDSGTVDVYVKMKFKERDFFFFFFWQSCFRFFCLKEDCLKQGVPSLKLD